jgi:hypothetical protein
LASVDLRRSTLATSNQRRQASWSAIPLKLKSLLSQRVLGNGFRKKLKALHPRRAFRIRQVSTTTYRAIRPAKASRFRLCLTYLATLIDSTFQNVTLQSEAIL